MNGLEVILYVVLTILVFVVLGLAVVFFVLRKKEKEKINNQEDDDIAINSIEKEKSINSKNNTNGAKIVKDYDVKSVFDFMEFETVKDNMIVQKDGKRFLMAIECKGVNYDLMSEIERASTEEGFSNFLNSLNEPIQIYIQTRTINLEKNISNYKDRIERMRDQINLKEFKLKEYSQRPNVNEKILKDKQFELMREKNLYSYGQDIVADTKKMSLNKNVLKKKYYIIIKYFYEPIDVEDGNLLSEEEIRDAAFSSLYTKALSLISVLSGIGIDGKALNSYELIELLYNAYNRDDSEIFGVEKAIEAGYDEIYVDSQNVIDKKIQALNNEIQLRAQNQAKEVIETVMDERSKELNEIEDNIEDIIEDLAKSIISGAQEGIPSDVKVRAIEKIEENKAKRNKKKKGVEETDGKKDTKESIRKHRAS